MPQGDGPATGSEDSAHQAPALGAPALFVSREAAPASRSLTPWAVAGVAVLLVVGALLLFSHHPDATGDANTLRTADPKAALTAISGVVMSESTSLSGGKSTYIDGHLRNHGASTLTGATVQVVFANDAGSPPQVETTTLTLIRTRQPYVDVEPVSAEPVKPGEDREFRLIFEGISPSWNQQIPEIRLIKVDLQ